MSQVDTPRRTPIDPRLRARRIAVLRDAGRRRRRRVVALLATVLAVGLGWALTRSPLLDVDQVAVDGAVHTTVADISTASHVDEGDALLYVDLAAVRRRVEALPWVASADVSRRWPGTLGITVAERVPVATLPARGGGWVIAASDGRLLDTTAEAPSRLPVIEGAGLGGVPGEVAPDAALGPLRVAGALPDGLRERVAAIGRVDGPGDLLELRVAMEEGHAVEVAFGPPEDVPAKLLALGALLDQADLSGATIIDLRVPGAPAVTQG